MHYSLLLTVYVKGEFVEYYNIAYIAQQDLSVYTKIYTIVLLYAIKLRFFQSYNARFDNLSSLPTSETNDATDNTTDTVLVLMLKFTYFYFS